MIRGRLVSPSIKNYGKKSNSRLIQIIHYKKTDIQPAIMSIKKQLKLFNKKM